LPTTSSSRKTSRRAPARRFPHRYKPIKLGKSRWILRASLATVVAVGLMIAWAVIARRVAPTSNTARDHFDAILVLGSPSDPDGNPTPIELSRVTEGVREYERGIAPRLIFSGGPAHNRFVEAEVMAGAAAARGIPPSAIFVETRAEDTIQNVCYSERVMKSHGWHSAEVISSASHLPRAGLILGNSALEWRTHAAPALEPGEGGSASDAVMETAKTIRYLVYANWAERCEP
jgi:uncharacterized SAM-binding protein YcdF (DUF218 family)